MKPECSVSLIIALDMFCHYDNSVYSAQACLKAPSLCKGIWRLSEIKATSSQCGSIENTVGNNRLDYAG